jgi:hypothetical protein
MERPDFFVGPFVFAQAEIARSRGGKATVTVKIFRQMDDVGDQSVSSRCPNTGMLASGGPHTRPSDHR